MTYAPNYDVAENVSPFVPLPMLVRCTRCREPQDALNLWAVAIGGRHLHDVCETCAKAVFGDRLPWEAS